MKKLGLFYCLLLSVQLFGQHQVTEQQKIDHLITFIKELKGAVFIRNGNEHTPEEAADHLQMKREKAGSRIKTAQDFIDKIATKSSMSGDLYMIRFANGKMFPSQMVLSNELKKLEAKSAAN
jgi:predicted ThiF/HesA family dinucleotide-utilizing enzyme